MNLSDRMKFYEKTYSPSKLCHTLPILVRLDGKAFHSFTKGLRQPFDTKFNWCMDVTAETLIKNTNALCAYIQSDEITLLYHSNKFESQVFMDAKRDKLNSILASMCTLEFNECKKVLLKSHSHKEALFDCRCWNVPSKEEAVNVFIWRQQDAIRNSIQGLAQANFSHKKLQGLNSKQVQEMLWQDKGINWNDLTPRLKRGIFIQRRSIHF